MRRRALVLLLFLMGALGSLHLYHKLSAEHTLEAQLENADGIPQSLLDLAERNPEATQFVMNYPKMKDTTVDIDLSSEVSRGEIPLFLQWDERWGYQFYGDDFLAVTGCGPTCLAMVSCGLTGNTEWNPYAVAVLAEQQGYYVNGKGSSWDMMTGLAGALGLQAQELSFDESHIRAALSAGRPIICIMGPGDFTSSGHFIVLRGIDADGKIIVNDPNSKTNSEKTWDIETLMSQMKNLWVYDAL